MLDYITISNNLRQLPFRFKWTYFPFCHTTISLWLYINSSR
nr:MAG TPA: hypothetical protein [Caudoviricetes sp.]